MKTPVHSLEKALALFTGAPYVVATDCCTHAIELCLRHDNIKKLSSSCYTYLSVPMTFVKLGIKFTLTDEKWLELAGGNQTKANEMKQESLDMENARASGKQKLKDLGLDDDEIKALTGA